MASIPDKELKKLKEKKKWYKIGFVFIFLLFLFIANQNLGVFVLGISANTGSMKPYIGDFCIMIQKQYSDFGKLVYFFQSVKMNENESNSALADNYNSLDRYKESDIKIGDVVNYRNPYFGLILHRVVGKCGDGLIIKGDANEYEDNICVPYGLINTKLVYKFC